MPQALTTSKIRFESADAKRIGNPSASRIAMGRCLDGLRAIATSVTYGWVNNAGLVRQVRLRNLGWARLVAAILPRMMNKAGPATVKLAQALSSRPDIVGESTAKTLATLQSKNPAAPWPCVAPIAASSLGTRWSSAFQEITTIPMAVGSIGQIHLARLSTGEQVCVKVKRPRVDHRIVEDLTLLRVLARGISRAPGLRGIPIEESIECLSQSLERQSDFLAEAGLTVSARQILSEAGIPVRIPRVYMEHCSHDVITLEHLDGVTSLGELSDENARASAAESLLAAFFTLLFGHGIVHADPHPGNVLVDASGTAVLMDFGMAAILSEKHRIAFGRLFFAMTINDGNTVAHVVLDTASQIPAMTQVEEFRSAVVRLVHAYSGRLMESFSITGFVSALFRLQRRYGIFGSPDFTTALTALVVLQGSLMRYAPMMDFQSVAAEAVLRSGLPSLSLVERRAVFDALQREMLG